MITRRMLRRSAVSWLVLSPLLVLALLPFAVMLSTALKPLSEVTAFPPRWLPSRLDWQNFVDMWATVDFGTGVANSLFVSLTATLLTVLVSVPAGYAMSRLPFRGTGLYRQFLLVTKMLSSILLVLDLDPHRRRHAGRHADYRRGDLPSTSPSRCGCWRHISAPSRSNWRKPPGLTAPTGCNRCCAFSCRCHCRRSQ
jgi:hypothetical protein